MVDSDDAESASGELRMELLARYGKALARRVARLVKPYDVEDVVQETYLRLFQAAKRQPIRSPRAFMFKTVRNLALNKLRWADALNHMVEVERQPDGESKPEHGLEDTADDRTPEAAAESEQEFSVLCQALRALPRQCRRVMLLRRVYGLSQKEVAAQLRLSEQTVHVQVARGINRCETYLLRKGVQL